MLYDKQVSIDPFDAGPVEKSPEVPGGYRDVVELMEGRALVGHWRVSASSKKVFMSHQSKMILGIPLEAGLVELEKVYAHFVPTDRRRLSDAIEKCFQSKRGFSAVLRVSVRHQIKVLEIYCDTILGEDGEIDTLIGSFRDITARAKLTAMSLGRSAVMRVLLRNIPSAIAVLDKNMVYLSASNHWAAGHGFATTEELIGHQHYTLFPHTKKFRTEHQAVLNGETLKRKRSILKDHNGEPIEQTCVMCPWRTSEGAVGGMIIMLGTVDIENTIRFANPASSAVDLDTSMLEVLESLE